MTTYEKVELQYLKRNQYKELYELMLTCYPKVENPAWEEKHVNTLINRFPKGQVVVMVDGVMAAASLSILIKHDRFDEKHTYLEMTANDTFDTHTPDGDTMYGLDVMVHPEYRGMRLGRRMYDYRKELCEELNLKGIVLGGRLPNYHQHHDDITPKEYIRKVKNKEIYDPVLSFQLSNDFHVKRLAKNYLPEDQASHEHAALLEWTNIYYEKPSDTKSFGVEKSIVRMGLVQWQMRSYKGLMIWLSKLNILWIAYLVIKPTFYCSLNMLMRR